LIYTGLEIEEADSVYEIIGKPGADGARNWYRKGLPGAMSLEFEMERDYYREMKGFGGLENWVRSRPETPIPAIRYIDAWIKDAPEQASEPQASVPKQILQYWKDTAVPSYVESLLDSWTHLDGYEVKRFDKSTARKFLRAEFGPNWSRAFNLAHNEKEQSDYFQLCLLAKLGGVWASPSECLYGDFAELLKTGSELTVIREPNGGAIGSSFIAARALHPAVVTAAKIAQAALLSRSREDAWNKTGSGVLTRAIGKYLLDCKSDDKPVAMNVLSHPEYAMHVSTQNPIRFKTKDVYMDPETSRAFPFGLWTKLVDALEEKNAPEIQPNAPSSQSAEAVKS
jgi:phosphoribosyl-AMP cyclohydrolase